MFTGLNANACERMPNDNDNDKDKGNNKDNKKGF